MVVGMLEEKLHIQHVTVLYRPLNAHLGADNAYPTPDSYNLLTVASVLCLHCEISDTRGITVVKICVLHHRLDSDFNDIIYYGYCRMCSLASPALYKEPALYKSKR